MFVTGAYGLLGSWLVKRLLELGAGVTVLKRDAVPARRWCSRAPNGMSTSCTATSATRHCSSGRSPSTRSTPSFTSPPRRSSGSPTARRCRRSRRTSAGPGLLLEACRALGVAARRGRRVRQGVRSARRASVPRGAARCSRAIPYDVSKAATDLIARSYWHTFELPVAVTRFANLYGGGDLNLSRLVPEAVLAALERPAARDPL